MAPEDLLMPVTIAMSSRKRIALIAHDNCKDDMLDWADTTCRSPAIARQHFLLSSPLMERSYERRLMEQPDVTSGMVAG